MKSRTIAVLALVFAFALIFGSSARAQGNSVGDFASMTGWPKISSETFIYGYSCNEIADAKGFGTTAYPCSPTGQYGGSTSGNGDAFTLQASMPIVPGGFGDNTQVGYSFADAGIVTVPGGGPTTVKLVDGAIKELGNLGTGAYIEVIADWGPITNNLIEIANVSDHEWTFTDSNDSSFCAERRGTVLPDGSNIGIQIPIDVGNNDGLLVHIIAGVCATSGGTVSLQDPFTVILPQGVTYSATTIPVQYAGASTTTPEPASLLLLGTGLLGLAWVLRRKGLLHQE